MNDTLPGRSDYLRLFPRSRLFAGQGHSRKSRRARVLGVHSQYRARVARPGQHVVSEKAGTREHGVATGKASRPQETSFNNRDVPRRPVPIRDDASCRRQDCVALVYVLETSGHFTPAPPDLPWADPRPDLTDDHVRWLALLELAHRRDAADPYGVFGALVGIRCCGAAITSTGGARPAWRLTRGELPAAEWQAVRTKWLMPHLKVLQELLGTPMAAPTEATQTP